MDRNKAFKLLADGALEDAYNAFEILRDEHPQDWAGYEGLAYLQAQLKKDLEEALSLAEKAKALGCPTARYHRIRADVLWRSGEQRKAVQDFGEAAKLDGTVDNLVAFANSLTKTGEHARAVGVWEEVIQRDPSNSVAYRGLGWIAGKRGDWTTSLEMSMKAKELAPDEPKALFQVGWAHHGLGQYSEALEYYCRADKLGFADKLLLHVNSAACGMVLGEYAMVIEHAYEAQAANPEDSRVRQLLKRCRDYLLGLWRENRDSEAYPIMGGALRLFPNDGMLLAYMAKLEIAFKRNYELGIEYMRQAFATPETDRALLYGTKGCLWFDYLNKTDEGLACLEKAVSLERTNPNLVALASRLGEVDSTRAERLFTEALASNPEDIDAIIGLAQIKFEQSKNTEGMEIVQKGCELDPLHPGITALLGYGYFEAGEFAESLRFYLKAQEMGFPDERYLYESIAQCYVKLNQPDEARNYAEKAAKCRPESAHD